MDGSAQSLLLAAPFFVIAISVLVVAAKAAWLLRHRPDLPEAYRRLGLTLIFGLLIFAVVDLASSFSLWSPDFQLWWLAAVAALIVMVGAAFAVSRVLPELLDLPSPRQLEQSNLKLKESLDAHLETVGQLRRVREDLEQEVVRRTSELAAINQRFRAALAGSDIAVFTQDQELRYTWAYDPHSTLNGEQWVGATDEAMFPGPMVSAIVEAKRSVIDSGQGMSLNIVLPTEGGVSRYLRLSIEPLREDDGEIAGLTSAVVDLTERHDYEARLSALTTSLAEANARFDLALRGSTIMVFSHDDQLRYNWVYNSSLGLGAEDLLGRRDLDVWDTAAVGSLVALKEAALQSGEVQNGDVALTLDEKERFFKVRLEPLLRGDVVSGLAGVAVDVTEARQQEAHLRLVMRELTHRSKNLLAVIQAMARQTAARSDDPQTFVTRFSARLRAMAASHDLLVAQEWHGVVLMDLVRAQLAQAIDPDSEQITIAGPMLSLKPDAGQNVGLALHELTTNASKYGALSVPEGKISIRWTIEEGGRFRLQWRESNGPSVGTPSRTGFGITLLERTVGQALDGTVQLSFRPDGVVCEIDFPASYTLAA